MATTAGRGFLNSFEGQIQPHLRQVSLVGEIDYLLSDALDALQLHVQEHRGYSTHAAQQFNRRYRVSLVAAIVAASRHHYRGGGLWPHLDELMTKRGDVIGFTTPMQQVFREIFIETLREYDLPTVGSDNNLVHTAAMHAGVPTYCLDDWFNIIHRARDRGTSDPADLTRWAVKYEDRAVMADVDQPIKRLLRSAPHFADDLFERSNELLDHIQRKLSPADMAGLAQLSQDDFEMTDVSERAWQVGLHPRWATMAIKNLVSDAHGYGDRNPHSGSTRRTDAALPTVSPALRLNQDEGQVEVLLPPVPAAPADVVWGVDQGSGTQLHTAQLSSYAGRSQSDAAQVPITNPQRTIGVTVAGQRTELTMWEEDHPVILFSATGRQINLSSRKTAPGSVWILTPRGTDIHVNGESVHALAVDDPPTGWGDWDLQQLALRPGDALECTDGSKGGFTISVGTKSNPGVIWGKSVPGTSMGGLTVMATRPKVELPANTLDWQISVYPLGSLQPSWTTTATGGSTTEVLSGVPRAAGLFELRVRGPLGRSVRETFALVDGLECFSNPPVRKLDARGQLPATDIRISASNGIAVSPARVALGPEQSWSRIEVDGPGADPVRLSVTAPATLVAFDSEKFHTRWGPRPIRVDVDSLAEGATLHVRLPGSPAPRAQAPTLLVRSGSVLVQEIRAKQGMRSLDFALDVLADTAAASGTLMLELSDGQPVATVMQFPEVNRISYSEDGRLEVAGKGADNPDLELWCWLSEANWREPALLKHSGDGHWELPISMIDAGQLRVHTRLADAWVPEPPPGLDVQTLPVDAPGHPRMTEGEQSVRQIAFGLAADLPVQYAPELTKMLLALLAHRPKGWPAPAINRFRQLLQDPALSAAVLMEVAGAQLDDETLIRFLLKFGLHLRQPSLTHDQSEQLWDSAPKLAGVFAASHLVGQAGPLTMASADRTDHTGTGGETGIAERRGLSTATAIFGDVYYDLATVGKDACPQAGQFDQNAVLAEANPAVLQAAVAQMGLAPKGLLDCDSRISRVTDLARKAQYGQIRGLGHLIPQTSQLLRELQTRGASSDLGSVRKLIPDSQELGHHWIPPFARAAGLLSRSPGAGWDPSSDQQRSLDQIARLAPELLLAELIRSSAVVNAAASRQRAAA